MTPFQDFIVAFQRSIKASQMYGTRHPRHLEFMRGLEAAYGGLLQGRSQVQLATRNGRLFLDKILEDSSNAQFTAMAKSLEERGVHALLLQPGATLEELQALLSVLSQKHAELKQGGGARKILEDQGVTHIRILATRLEEVGENGEVVAAFMESVASLGTPKVPEAPQPFGAPKGTAETGDPGLPRPVPMRNTMFAPGSASSVPTLVEQLQGFLLNLAGNGQAAANLSGLGDFLESQGLDRQGAQPGTQGVLSQALTALPSGPRLGVFLGATELRSNSLRNTFGRMAGSLGVSTLAHAYLDSAIDIQELGSHSEQLRNLSPAPERWGEQLAQALHREGVSEGQLKELLEVLTWESLAPETKLARLLQGQRAFELPTAKVLAFLRELLEGGKIPEFLRLLRHYASGLLSPALNRRRMVAEAFISIADWVDIPGMPLGVTQDLHTALNQAWGREKEPEVHVLISAALEHLLWHWIQQGEPERMATLFGDLQDVATELSPPSPWKSEASRALLARLGTPERVRSILERIPTLAFPDIATQVLPYLRMLGGAGVNLLVECLALEQDRTRRSRFLEALKACGSASETPLLDSLHASDWFVVRNALIVLGEVAGPERAPEVQACLSHPDVRVQRAAIRTLGRLGGRAAENAILPLLETRDPETQIEVLFALSELNSKNVIPGLLQFLRNFKGKGNPAQERVRERTIEVLGLLRSPSVIPTLEELLARHRRFFMENKESLAIRRAALRALLTLESPEAQAVIAKVLEAEPKGAEQQALQQILTDFLAAARPLPSDASPMS